MYLPIEDRGGFTLFGFKKIRGILREKLRVEEIPATKYALTNRYKTRKLHNLGEVLKSFNENFPQYKWEIVPLSYESVAVCAKTLASFIVWFTPCGSQMSNSIFMHKDCGICISMSNIIDYQNYQIVYVSPVWVIGFNNKYGHQDPKGGNSTIDKAVRCMGILLETMKNKKWPNVPNSFHPVNTTIAYNRMKNDIYKAYRSVTKEDHVE